jgi:hypothetical protein
MKTPHLRGANAHRAAAGAAAQVQQAYLALRRATDPGVIAVLRARIDHPDESLGQLGARLGITKDAYAGRLRRAIDEPASTTRTPAEPPTAPVRAGQPTARSARAIRIGTGRRPL